MDARSLENPASLSVWFVGPRRIELRREELKPEPGRTLVSSTLMGISAGTELLFYRGDFPRGLPADLPGQAPRLDYPLKYGYSNVGRTPDGRRVFGFQPHQDLWTAAPEELVELPAGVDDSDGVFIPNLETALGLVQDLAPLAGECLAVVGCGVVGLLAAEVLKRSHLGPIILCDLRESRRELARGLGLAFVNPAIEPVERGILELSGGRGLDRGVNTSASPAGLQLLLDNLAMEGTAVEASWYGDRPVTLNLGRGFHRRRLTIKASQVSNLAGALAPRWDKPRRMGEVLSLLAEIRPSKYVTHSFKLEQAARAFALLDEGGDAIQVVLEP